MVHEMDANGKNPYTQVGPDPQAVNNLKWLFIIFGFPLLVMLALGSLHRYWQVFPPMGYLDVGFVWLASLALFVIAVELLDIR